METEEVDKHIREQLEGLNSIPPQVRWKPEQGWNKLNHRLPSGTKRKNSITKYALGSIATLLLVSTAIFFNQKVFRDHSDQSSDFSTINYKTEKHPRSPVISNRSSNESKTSAPASRKEKEKLIEIPVKQFDATNSSLTQAVTAIDAVRLPTDSEQVEVPGKSVTRNIQLPNSLKERNRVYGKIPPPGTVEVEGENIFVDKTEIQNLHWHEFLYYVRIDSGETYYNAMLPDSSLAPWMQKWRSPEYRYYPIIGISYYQATQYCIWRTNTVNQMKQLTFPINYRLPSKEEWETIAKYCIQKGFTKKNNLDAQLPNDKIPTWARKLNWKKEMRKKNYQYTFYIFDILGNVAEMTSEVGTAKGGSWKYGSSDVDVDSVFHYDHPCPWLGFRCVAEYLQE